MKCDDKIKNRVKRTRGQIDGILKMMEDERECEEVLNQLSAELGCSTSGSDSCTECIVPFSKIDDFTTIFRRFTKFDEREES